MCRAMVVTPRPCSAAMDLSFRKCPSSRRSVNTDAKGLLTSNLKGAPRSSSRVWESQYSASARLSSLVCFLYFVTAFPFPLPPPYATPLLWYNPCRFAGAPTPVTWEAPMEVEARLKARVVIGVAATPLNLAVVVEGEVEIEA